MQVSALKKLVALEDCYELKEGSRYIIRVTKEIASPGNVQRIARILEEKRIDAIIVAGECVEFFNIEP